jgi:hypothetical protein
MGLCPKLALSLDAGTNPSFHIDKSISIKLDSMSINAKRPKGLRQSQLAASSSTISTACQWTCLDFIFVFTQKRCSKGRVLNLRESW